MKEAFSAIRVHLNTCRLLEEKSVPPVVDKYGWCTWDAFYLTVEPVGVWSGVKKFYDNGVRVRFLIIDDGWQSIEFDGGSAQNLILGGQQMLGRLYRFEECGKFRKYKAGSLLGLNPPLFDPKRLKMIIFKALEKEDAEKAREAIKSGDLVGLDLSSLELKIELNEMYNRGRDGDCDGEGFGQHISEFGLKAFIKDLRTRFPNLDDIYVWQALCGAWGGVRPGATQFDAKIVYAKLSEGLDGTMEDLATVKMVESGIGLVHPN